MLTPERKAELIRNGYHVENMTTEYGSSWWDETPFRWMNISEMSWGDPCVAEEEAWAFASKDYEERSFYV
jgi:hypothetical protein